MYIKRCNTKENNNKIKKKEDRKKKRKYLYRKNYGI